MVATPSIARKEEHKLLAGRYVLGEKLGSGGLASVYRGRLVGPGGFARPVAIKRLHPHWGGRADAAMFLDEARIASCIVHPNVVATLEVLSEANEYMVVMELVDGPTLEALLARGAPPLAITARVLSDALRGLHAAHEAMDAQGERLNVVHRDVAPCNILVGRDGIVRISDFGVAKARGRIARTSNGQVKGHLSYMAPEQLAGDAVDARTDVFGAGIVLWEAITGQRLFQGETEAQTVYAVLERIIPSPGSVISGLPDAVDAVVLKALARDPSDRFPSALAMAEALEAATAIATREAVTTWVSGGTTTTVDAPALAATDAWLEAAPAAPAPSRRGRRAIVAAAMAVALSALAASAAGMRDRVGGPAQLAISPAAEAVAASGPPPVDRGAPSPAEVSAPVLAMEPNNGAGAVASAAPVVSAGSAPRPHARPPVKVRPRSHPATPVRLYERD